MLAKERSVDMYKLSAYLISRNTSNLPLEVILDVLFLVIVYFMAGTNKAFVAFSLTYLKAIFLSIIAAQPLEPSPAGNCLDVDIPPQ
ncbi:hypothetical protein F0562_006536 [Nyssa sinensis]|uniref:ABC-2 type transporter transmembrane domain-containing protein n=1 Tax=Nyssa sinensis TaxID=561372 RepID=A0A5J5AQV4_9ASTE|nr:hypothetical protein F0562_006536 [Nyssa sinensis]